MKQLQLIVCALALVACAGPSPAPPRDAHAGPASAPLPGVSPTGPVEAASVASLTLAEALERADREHPDLSSWRALVRAAEGRLDQAGAWPNPELIVRIENVPVNRGVGGQGRLINQGNYLAGLSQQIPIGGRVGASQDVAERELARELAALQVRRAEVHAAVRLAHAQAVLAGAERELDEETLRLASALVEIARARVEAGDAVGSEVDRAGLEELQAAAALERARAAEALALRALAGATGATTLQVTGVSDAVDQSLDPAAIDALLARAERSPSLRLAQAEVEAAAARVELAEAERWPDLAVEVLYRRLELTNQHSLDAGLRIGLPLFDRRSGEIAARKAELAAAGARQRGARNQVLRELATAHEQLLLTSSLARRLGEEAIPRATRAVETWEARWQAGDLSLAEVVPARRVLLELRSTWLAALQAVALHAATLERLLGPEDQVGLR